MKFTPFFRNSVALDMYFDQKLFESKRLNFLPAELSYTANKPLSPSIGFDLLNVSGRQVA